MTESEFNRLADAVFARIEEVIDSSDADIEYDSNGSVLELELEDGSKIIINRHVPNREIWLAAKSGGFHYAWVNEQWWSERDGSELYAKLSSLIAASAGITLDF